MITGLIIGGIAAAAAPWWEDDDYDGYGPGYDAPPPGGYARRLNAVGLRHRLFDPASGPYLGHDGLRHDCR